jgi:hypothetical protein
MLEVEAAANAVYAWAAEQIVARRLAGELRNDPVEYAHALRHEAQALLHRAHDKLMRAFLDPEVFSGGVRVLEGEPRTRRRGSASELLQHQRRAADAPVREAPNGILEPDRRGLAVEPDDRGVQPAEIARAHLLADADRIAHAERRERGGRAHGQQKPAACLHGGGERVEVRIELAGHDRVEQRAFGVGAHAATAKPSSPTEASSVRMIATGSS